MISPQLRRCLERISFNLENPYRCQINWYQENARIYLDEYEVEEVDLRVNFDTSLLIKRFMVKE